MKGYYNKPDATREAIDTDGWFHTGDIGEMDDEGYLNIVGRIKDMIIRGGENIYPAEIERVMAEHPQIQDVAVIGVPDEKYGEELCAWIKLRDGAEPLDADAVRAFATGKLAHYKIPRYVRIVEEFPMTVTGKIRKVEMREVSVEELGLQPKLRLVGYAYAGVAPHLMGIGPVPAIEAVVEKAGLHLADIDRFEINEAFAVVPMVAMKELNIPHEKLNVFGGAVALGHPIGASGARTLVTLLNAMRRRNAKIGINSLCIGGGEATAVAVELV